MGRTLLHLPLLSVVFPYVMSPNFLSPLILSHYSRTFLLMRLHQNALIFCVVVHLRLPFRFLRKFLIKVKGTAKKSESFSFNEIMYCRIEGVTMGSPLGPILDNIFVGFQERHLFHRFPKPFIYFHNVYDISVSFRSRNDALLFLDKLNELNSSLTFSLEEENNNKLPFWDILVKRCDSSFLTSVYRIPTFTGLYLSWHSFALKSRKLDLIRCISYRALNICSDSKIEDELKVIKDIFIINGNPEEVIDDNIQ